MSPQTPTHDLGAIQEKVRVGFVHYRREALLSAFKLQCSHAEIDECILALLAVDFHKTMPAHNPKWKDCWQDVYKPLFNGTPLYVKLQLFPGQRVHVVSFKEKDEDGID